jgi:hypothetical protein
VKERPVLGSWQALLDYLHADMAHNPVERVRVLFLNSKNMLIRDDQMSEGSVDEAAVYIREIIRRALDYHATGLYPRPQPPQRRLRSPANRTSASPATSSSRAGTSRSPVHDHSHRRQRAAQQHAAHGAHLGALKRMPLFATRAAHATVRTHMIARYARPQMTSIWDAETRFRIWFEIEAHALGSDGGARHRAQGKPPPPVWERGAFEVERIDAIEAR